MTDSRTDETPWELDQVLASVRRDVRDYQRPPNTAALVRALTRRQARTRRRVWGASACMLIVLVAWSVAVVLPPSSRACANLAPGEVFDLGLIPALNLALCSVLVHRGHVGAQLFVRACCWSYLVLGALSTIAAPGLLPVVLPLTGVGAGAALLMLGDHGLTPEFYNRHFRPIAHRAVLSLIVVLAVADLQTLLAVNQANEWRHTIDMICALAMGGAVAGLYRTRVWGLVANVVINVAIAALAITGQLAGVPTILAGSLCATAIAQTALLAPLAVTLSRGFVLETPRLDGALSLIARAVVLTLLAGSALGLVLGPSSASRDAYCEARLQTR